MKDRPSARKWGRDHGDSRTWLSLEARGDPLARFRAEEGQGVTRELTERGRVEGGRLGQPRQKLTHVGVSGLLEALGVYCVSVLAPITF